MTRFEFVVFFLVFEQRFQERRVACTFLVSVLQFCQDLVQIGFFVFIREERCTHGDEQSSVVREDYVFWFDVQCLDESLSQFGQE